MQRAIADLATLNETEFLDEVSEGMGHILSNARAYLADAAHLEEAHRYRSAEILHALAEEEAAKFFILMDAVRCSRQDRGKHLSSFYDHRSKAIYGRYYKWRPVTFGEVRGWVEQWRKEHYLDGPTGFEYLYLNADKYAREERMYVDYVRTQLGLSWQYPNLDERLFSWPSTAPAVLEVAVALSSCGLDQPEALRVVEARWQHIRLDDETRWEVYRDLNVEVVRSLREAGLMKGAADDVGQVVNSWPFPLSTLNTKSPRWAEQKDDLEELREIQRRSSLGGPQD